jgi:hypothetical protein
LILIDFDKALESVILTWLPSWRSEFQMKFQNFPPWATGGLARKISTAA